MDPWREIIGWCEDRYSTDNSTPKQETMGLDALGETPQRC